MALRRASHASLFLFFVVIGCARSEPRSPAHAVIAEPASPDESPGPAAPAQPAPDVAGEPTGTEPSIARLTGGVGNKVVRDFDQLRAAVRRLGPAIDDCYRSTSSEGGWRENLMWNLDVSARGTVTRVTPHYAEYWRGDKIVPATPAPGLAACMQRTLGQLVIAQPVSPGWVRLRFEL